MVEGVTALAHNPAVMTGIRNLIAFSLLGLVAACGWAEWPPPGKTPSPTAQPVPATGKTKAARVRSSPSFITASAVTVGKGDTVYALSRRHGVSVRSIIVANSLRPPYHLKVGQRVQLPRERQHKVQKGENLYAVSRAYDVNVYDLARANRIDAPYTVVPGQFLRIPSREGAGAASGAARGRTPAPAKVQTAAIGAPPPKPKALPRAPVKRPAAVPRPPASSGSGFLWPVKGKVVSNYGAKAKGLHNDGINIAAPRGTAVRAADNGVVAYAGNELRGFGNLLLIKHAGGWVTAYAHNDTLSVKRGQKVKRGQVIARVGSSGSVRSPQLHFELRRGKRTVDPKRYLRA